MKPEAEAWHETAAMVGIYGEQDDIDYERIEF
jgi:hypothetical protein